MQLQNEYIYNEWSIRTFKDSIDISNLQARILDDVIVIFPPGAEISLPMGKGVRSIADAIKLIEKRLEK